LLAALLAGGETGRITHTIFVPAMTFAVVHNAVKLAGFGIGYLDADLESWQVSDQPQWKAALKACGAIIDAPCYGKFVSPGINRRALEGPNSFIIEDCAESFGADLNGVPAGSWGNISCLSFFANKICTAGEGGAIMTGDDDLAVLMRSIIHHGIPKKDYISTTLGFNGKMTDMQAAVLCAQLDRMPQMVTKRRAILGRYYAAAQDNKWTFPTIHPGETPAPWIFAGIPADRADVIRRCEAANIEWRPFFPIPVEAQKWTPIVNGISAAGICLPLSSALTESEIQRVEEVIYGR